jgi:hypothetical protein
MTYGSPDDSVLLTWRALRRSNRWSTTPVTTPDGALVTARVCADQLNVGYVPTAVSFDHGKEVIRMEAMLKAFHVQSVIDYVASGAYRDEPSFQRFVQTPPSACATAAE